jgi:hypothetical protein
MKITDDVKAHLAALEVAGRLTPEAVVEDAKREDSPLHGFFKWDLQTAAEIYWLDRARQLIRAVKVVIVRNDYSFKAPFYVPDPARAHKEQGYTSLVTLKQDPVAARESLLQECERAAASLKRAQKIAMALGLEAEIDDILARLSGFTHHISLPVSEQATSVAS